MAIRGFYLLALGYALASCSAPDEPQRRRDANWKNLPDGSRYTEQRHEGEVLGATRCWPKGDGWDCLKLIFDNRGGSFAQRRVVADFSPFDSLPFPSGVSGYQCSISPLASTGWAITEEIHDGSDNLVMKNTAFPNEGATVRGELWSTQYVGDFLRENRIAGGAPFSCFALWQIMSEGSPATFRTTAVSLDRIDSYNRKRLSDPLAVD